MKMKNLYLFLLSVLVVFTMSSCSKTISPNAQKMIGQWAPEKVEKVYTPEQLQQMEQLKQQQAAAQSSGQAAPAGGQTTARKQPGSKSTSGTTGTTAKTSTQAGTGQQSVAKDTTRTTAGAGGRGSNDVDRAARAAAALDRMVQSEMRAKLAINPDGTAQKFYPGKTVKATWKMKRNGKAVVAKNIQTKDKFVLEIEELTDTRAVIIENLPVGTLRITYVKEH